MIIIFKKNIIREYNFNIVLLIYNGKKEEEVNRYATA